MECRKITEINVRFIKSQSSLLAFSSCIFDDSLFLNDIAIHRKLTGGYRLVFPARKFPNNQHISIFNPINRATELLITEAIAEEYAKLVNKHFVRNDD